MSAEIYHVGSTTTPIILSVAVSTPGIADTDPEVIGSGGVNHLPVISGPTGANYAERNTSFLSKALHMGFGTLLRASLSFTDLF